MEMNLPNSDWDNKPQVKKGNIGEQIVHEYLEKRGFVVYKPTTNMAHAFDRLAIKNKEKIMIVETKTKARLNKYPATGFNYNHYLEYKNIEKKHNLDVFVFFVDEMLGQVYGNYLRYMEQPAEISGVKYPLRLNNVIVFPLDNMKVLKTLTEEQANTIKKYQTRNYKYIA